MDYIYHIMLGNRKTSELYARPREDHVHKYFFLQEIATLHL